MPKRSNHIPTALTIAGSDSGGGAGIQADLKVFASLGVHGTCAITCLTAQNPEGVRGIQAARTEMVRLQIESVFAELQPAAVKIGMLYSAQIIRMVGSFFQKGPHPPLVVDPVMVATSGARLLEPSSMRALQHELLPQAALITPNLAEAQALLGEKLRTPEDLRGAAKELHHRFGCAVLVKGGHMRGLKEAVDFFCDGSNELMLSAPFVSGMKLHGAGCTLSAAITAYLALGRELPAAVAMAKTYITGAIMNHRRTAGHLLLNSLWMIQPRPRGRPKKR